MARGQAEARSFSRRLGREKRIENAGKDRLWDSRPVIANLPRDVSVVGAGLNRALARPASSIASMLLEAGSETPDRAGTQRPDQRHVPIRQMISIPSRESDSLSMTRDWSIDLQDHRSARGSLNGPERLPMRGCRGRLPARLRVALSVHLQALGTGGAITGMLRLRFDRLSASDAGQSCRHAMNSLGAEDGLREAAQSNRQSEARLMITHIPYGRLKVRRRDAWAGIAAD